MTILDTNVLSETMLPAPSARVLHWLASQAVGELCTTAITKAEILAGIARMPVGRRRRELENHAYAMFKEDFDRGILSFDGAAAELYAEIMAARYAAGRVVGELDVEIAAIARLHNATLATRNTTDFEDCGICLVNPWEA
jgi:predicted nucleic acid-binding protein